LTEKWEGKVNYESGFDANLVKNYINSKSLSSDYMLIIRVGWDWFGETI
jgi:hypothetical protein